MARRRRRRARRSAFEHLVAWRATPRRRAAVGDAVPTGSCSRVITITDRVSRGSGASTTGAVRATLTRRSTQPQPVWRTPRWADVLLGRLLDRLAPRHRARDERSRLQAGRRRYASSKEKGIVVAAGQGCSRQRADLDIRARRGADRASGLGLPVGGTWTASRRAGGLAGAAPWPDRAGMPRVRRRPRPRRRSTLDRNNRASLRG